ncbi:cytochrome c maturation protein CcmE [Acidiferrobacter sp.]|jgi:cytochrome c-type biogenesis protein CcmE|uniref:cytochrome c maturation protein CcmE n=1 Tax=Acidiferrobacter sp. TaxID=1872107 RepID=UPI0026303B66|nr:cytochrome c maturation protein CcmE [Acidiferrobacter sp.]
MRKQNKRLVFVLVGLAGVSVAVWLVLTAFRHNLVFFYSPTQVLEGKAPSHGVFRLGGIVKKGSIKKDGLHTTFVLTDLRHSMVIHYTGILPDLFRQGQGVVVQGRRVGTTTFMASQVLAKHGANYMPPDVAAELKRSMAAKAKAALS